MLLKIFCPPSKRFDEYNISEPDILEFIVHVSEKYLWDDVFIEVWPLHANYILKLFILKS